MKRNWSTVDGVRERVCSSFLVSSMKGEDPDSYQELCRSRDEGK